MIDSALRASLVVVLLAILSAGGATAQVRVRTETIRPPAAAVTPPAANQFVRPEGSTSEPPGGTGATEMARLPPAVLATRARILTAAHTGDLEKFVALMRAEGMPAFTHTQRQDPTALWKQAYPDSDGVEILAILISILETEAVRVDAGTPQEMYVWPYFARLPIKSLTPEQKVELFQVVTGADYKGMLERGRYVFYQVGIGPDGAWRYFISSDQ
jgi:hypothetical protein